MKITLSCGIILFSCMNISAETQTPKNENYKMKNDSILIESKKNNLDFSITPKPMQNMNITPTANMSPHDRAQYYINKNDPIVFESKKYNVDFFDFSTTLKPIQNWDITPTANMSPHDRAQHYINKNNFYEFNQEMRNQQIREKYKNKKERP